MKMPLPTLVPLVTNGLAVTHFPDAPIGDAGFALGSDLTGDPDTQSKGCLDNRETFIHVLRRDAIAADDDAAVARDEFPVHRHAGAQLPPPLLPHRLGSMISSAT